MKSILIKHRGKKEFDKAFSLLIEFGKERNRLTLDDEICFAFLLKAENEVVQLREKVI